MSAPLGIDGAYIPAQIYLNKIPANDELISALFIVEIELAICPVAIRNLARMFVLASWASCE